MKRVDKVIEFYWEDGLEAFHNWEKLRDLGVLEGCRTGEFPTIMPEVGEEFEVEVPLDELEKPPNSMNAPDRDEAASGAEAGTATIATVNLTAPGIEPDATGRKKRKKNSAAGCCGAKPSKGTA